MKTNIHSKQRIIFPSKHKLPTVIFAHTKLNIFLDVGRYRAIFGLMRKLAMEELGRPSVESFKLQEKLPVTLILDSIRSMHNVGSIFRTADGFAVEKIILCGITGVPPHREIEKTALGATQSISWAFEKDVTNAIEKLKQQSYQVIAIEQADRSTKLHQFMPKAGQRYALILGNEVNGVSDEALALSATCLEIPQFGTKHSFNVVVSAGIVLWDFYSKLNLKP